MNQLTIRAHVVICAHTVDADPSGPVVRSAVPTITHRDDGGVTWAEIKNDSGTVCIALPLNHRLMVQEAQL